MFEEQLAYIEAINLQVKFKTEFQKCKSDIDLSNWLKFLLIALHHEPYIGRNIIVFLMLRKYSGGRVNSTKNL